MQLDDHPTVKAYREKMAKGEIPLRDEKLDSDWLRALALDAGADDVGFVDIDRTAIADERDDILEAFPKTLSFMALICKLNPENIRCVGSITGLLMNQGDVRVKKSGGDEKSAGHLP